MAKTTATPQPPIDLTTMSEQFEAGDVESLVRLYAGDAEIALHAPDQRQILRGPIGLREGLERIAAGGLAHDLRLAGIGYGGGYVLDRCRDLRTGRVAAWGGLTICRGLISRHTHAPAWNVVRPSTA
jgi:hypothetical protein